ncbi:MAG TPA: hypothetical protein VMS77_02110 [Conexivisphaerales archaeon]|nr:hypothetical protein [Conexivisphaerales archaeon]
MAGTRAVTIVGVALLVGALGMDWIQGQDSYGMMNWQEVWMQGGETFSNVTYDGFARNIYIPYLNSTWQLTLGAVLFPAGFLVALFSVVKWKCLWLAGLINIAGALSWVWGVLSVPPLASLLCSWYGYTGMNRPCTPGYIFSLGPGPFAALAGGAVLLAAYLLTRKGMLDYPLD